MGEPEPLSSPSNARSAARARMAAVSIARAFTCPAALRVLRSAPDGGWSPKKRDDLCGQPCTKAGRGCLRLHRCTAALAGGSNRSRRPHRLADRAPRHFEGFKDEACHRSGIYPRHTPEAEIGGASRRREALQRLVRPPVARFRRHYGAVGRKVRFDISVWMSRVR